MRRRISTASSRMSPAGRRCRGHGGRCMSGRPFARGAMTVDLEAWIKERRITEVECMVSDGSGIPRGKILPASKFLRAQIGKASGRERVWTYVWVSVVAVALKKKN